MAPDYLAKTQGGMLRNGAPLDIVRTRRSRSRSRPPNGRLECFGRPRDDGAGRRSPPLSSGAQFVRPMHTLERGERRSIHDVLPGFADALKPQRECDTAELRRKRADLAPGFRHGQEYSQNSIDYRGPPRRTQGLHPSPHHPEDDGRGRPIRAYEELHSFAGTDRGSDGPRHKDLKAQFSGRDINRSVDPRDDSWRPGGKGSNYACVAFIDHFVEFGNGWV
jgi:hypothetical protein